MTNNVTKFPHALHVAERKRIIEDAREALMLTGLSELEAARLWVELGLNRFVVMFPPGKLRNDEMDLFVSMITERRDMVIKPGVDDKA